MWTLQLLCIVHIEMILLWCGDDFFRWYGRYGSNKNEKNEVEDHKGIHSLAATHSFSFILIHTIDNKHFVHSARLHNEVNSWIDCTVHCASATNASYRITHINHRAFVLVYRLWQPKVHILVYKSKALFNVPITLDNILYKDELWI